MNPGDGGSQTAQDNRAEGVSGITAVPFASATQLKPLLPQEDDHSAFLQYPDVMFADSFLGLSHDNIFFLDQVFMDDSGGSTERLGQGQGTRQDIQASTIGDGQPSNNEQEARIDVEESHQPPWLGSVANSDTAFTAALHCYFKFAAPWLPILIEDAFWQDYHNGLCSHILASAIACCGAPFTILLDKWSLQQRFARDFREAFLSARNSASDDGTIRLDEIEALALMVNFKYEDAGSPLLHSNLGRLFLKHEALVMMTLQSPIQDHVATGPDTWAMLARARERRVLLYWHVYGLDAFHCLDRRQVSLIGASDNEGVPQHEAKDFLDSVLELAVIARSLLQKLCSNSVKRSGIEPNDIQDIYEQIYHWRNHTCPPHLRRHEESPGTLAAYNIIEDHSTEMRRHIQLHRAVLWALEINCFMHVESCVSDFGIKRSDHLRAEMITARVEHESLRALNDMLDICRWTDMHDIREGDGKRQSLIDLAPLALRNVCAGLCFWTCQRGIETGHHGSAGPVQYSNTQARSNRKKARINCGEHPIHAHLENARLLRDAAAKATSHRDTADILKRLDREIALLKAELDNASGAE